MTSDDFERRLSRELHALVDDEHPPLELRERLADSIHEPPAPQTSWVPTVAAVVVAVALLGAFLALRDDDPVAVDLASEPADPSPAETAPTTTATAVPTPVAPAPATDDEPAVTVPPTTAPAVAPSTTLAPAPTTTALVCQNSTNPSCGPFRWSPPPENEPATVSVSVPEGPIVAGEEIELTISMSDPDGAVTLDCYSVDLDRPGSSLGACSVSNPDDCPDRYGDWTPPEPKPQQADTTTIVEFSETGTYEVTVDVSPADGCDNVDPYRSGGEATITVEVVAPQPSPGG